MIIEKNIRFENIDKTYNLGVFHLNFNFQNIFFNF